MPVTDYDDWSGVLAFTVTNVGGSSDRPFVEGRGAMSPGVSCPRLIDITHCDDLHSMTSPNCAGATENRRML